jgi:hypothetical protein
VSVAWWFTTCAALSESALTQTRSAAGSRDASRRSQTTKGRDGRASLFANGLGMRTAPSRACQLCASAPAHVSGASRMSAGRPKAAPEPLNPPSAPASPFERRFTAPPPQRPTRGRQKTRGIPISPRGPTCSHHSRLAARAHALCQRGEMRGSMQACAGAGISLGGECARMVSGWTGSP